MTGQHRTEERGSHHDLPLTQLAPWLQQIACGCDHTMAPVVIPRALLAAGIASGLLLGPALAPAAAQQSSAPPPLRIGGSSTVYPLLNRAIQQFRQASRGDANAPLQLSEDGTGGGLRRFCQGQLLIANASRPINGRELKACQSKGVQFIELPVAYDAITVVVNPRNSWARLITTSELARLWNSKAQGRINRWNQVNIDWPDRPIRLCAPGKDSGTYDMFNQAINGNATNARQDVVSSEDDNVLVKCVANDPNAIGYFGYSYYAGNRSQLRALSVLGPRGAVAPSADTVQNETYQPLSRPLFLYVNDQLLRRSELGRRFLTWTLRNGLRLSQEAGLIPLSSSTFRLVETKLYRHVLGTAFGGDLQVGRSVSETLRRSLETIKRPQFR